MIQSWLNQLFAWLPDDMRVVVVFGIIIVAAFALIRMIVKIMQMIPFV